MQTTTKQTTTKQTTPPSAILPSPTRPPLVDMELEKKELEKKELEKKELEKKELEKKEERKKEERKEEERRKEEEKKERMTSAPAVNGFAVEQQREERRKLIEEEKIEWNNAMKVTASEEGSVFFVEVLINGPSYTRPAEGREEEKETIVVKGAGTVVQELFGHLLYSFLHIPSPTVRLIQVGDGEEYNALQRRMRELADPTDGTLIKVERDLSRPFILAMEYFPNVNDFYHLHPSLLGLSNCRKLFHSERMLTQLARIIIADVVINNWDRLPIIWDNHGNASNLIYQFAYLPSSSSSSSSDGGCYVNQLGEGGGGEREREIDLREVRIVSIDQAITPILNEAQDKVYKERIERMVEQLLEGGEGEEEFGEESPSQRLRQFIIQLHQFDIGVEGMRSFRLALIDAILHTLSLLSFSPSLSPNPHLQRLHRQLEQMCKEDRERVYEKGLEMVSLSFLSSNLSVLHRFLPRLLSARRSLSALHRSV